MARLLFAFCEATLISFDAMGDTLVRAMVRRARECMEARRFWYV